MKNKIATIFVCLIMLIPAVAVALETVSHNGAGSNTGSGNIDTRISGITFYQVDYVFHNGRFLNSDTGKILIDIPTLSQTTHLEKGYVNVFTSSGWVIRNLPFDKSSTYTKKSTYFDLGQTGNVRTLKVYLQVTQNIQTRFTGILTTSYTVYDTIYGADGDSESDDFKIPKAPDMSSVQFNPSEITLSYTQPNHHPSQNVETACMQCVPAAYANNLQYLEDTFDISVPDVHVPGIGYRDSGIVIPSDSLVGHLDVYMKRKLVNRSSGNGTGTENALNGILKYASDNSIPIDIEHQGIDGDTCVINAGKTSMGMGASVNWNYLINEVKYGHAVTLRYWRFENGIHYGGHKVAVVTAGWYAGAKFIEFAHDTKQTCGDPTDSFGREITHSYLGLNTTDGNFTLLACPAADDPAEIVRIVTMEANNNAPYQPVFVSGQMYPTSNTSYVYTFSTNDPEANLIYYKFDWGDGEFSDWLGPISSGTPVTRSHVWNLGIYGIRVKARDQFWAESAWSLPVFVLVDVVVILGELYEIAVFDLPYAKIGDKKVDGLLDRAIKHLNKGLDDKLWLDNSNLDQKHGKKVFKEGKAAVKDLQKLQKDKRATDSVQGTCEDISFKIAALNGLLANIALNEAQRNGGTDKGSLKKVAKAELEFNKGLDQLGEGKPDKAIGHFGKAWMHSQKVIG